MKIGKSLQQIVGLGFNADNAPNEHAKLALPTDLHCPEKDVIDKTVIFLHEESTFQSNEDQPAFWGCKGTVVIKLKSKGSGIMVSDFINERNGYLCSAQEQYTKAREADSCVCMEAKCLFEY